MNREEIAAIYILDETDKELLSQSMQQLADQLWDILYRRKMEVNIEPCQSYGRATPINNKAEISTLNDLNLIF